MQIDLYIVDGEYQPSLPCTQCHQPITDPSCAYVVCGRQEQDGPAKQLGVVHDNQCWHDFLNSHDDSDVVRFDAERFLFLLCWNLGWGEKAEYDSCREFTARLYPIAEFV